MLCQIVKMTCGGRRKDKSPHSHWLKIESGHASIPASEGFWSGGGEYFSTQGLSAAAARCCGDGSKLEQPTPNTRHIAMISQLTINRFIMRKNLPDVHVVSSAKLQSVSPASRAELFATGSLDISHISPTAFPQIRSSANR